MHDSQPSTQSESQAPQRSIRRVVLYLLSISPVLLLVALLAWGQLHSGGNPGGLVEHDQLGEVTTTQRAAPSFEGIDLMTGQMLDSSELSGKIVVVSFWSSWCVSCRSEAAALASVYREYEDHPVEFIGLAIWDDNRGVLDHIERFSVTYPNILDPRGSSAVSFGVTGVPEKFFLDEEGRIIRKIIGPMTQERLRSVLDELLASSETA